MKMPTFPYRQKTMVFLAALLISGVTGLVNGREPPKIGSPESDFDFGSARSGTVVEHTFVLENVGGGILEIASVRTSCGCTASEVGNAEIPGGEQTTLKVFLDLAGRSGPQTQRITVRSNDRTQPHYTLTLRGEAVPTVSLTPRTINFQQIDPARPPTGEIEVRAHTEAPLEILSVGTTMNRSQVTLETVEAERVYRVLVTPEAVGEYANYNDVVEIKTNDTENAVLRAIVMWQVVPQVSFTPRILTLPMEGRNPTLNRFIMIRGGDDLEEPLKVLAVRWQGREPEVAISDMGNFGTRVELRNIRPEADMGGETLEIDTNVPGFETLRIPVRVIRP